MATLKIDLIISHVINNIQIPDGSLKTKEKARGCVKTKAHLLFYLKIVVPLFFVYATIFSVIR